MNPARRQILLQLLNASGCTDANEANALADAPVNGNSWTAQVLDSGKVDEAKFTEQLGILFKTPVESINLNRIDRASLSVLPSRFVFKHHILPLEADEESIRLATYDIFNMVARRLAGQLLNKKIEWVLVPRTQLLRAIQTVYGVGAETLDEILKTNRSFEAFDERAQSMDLNADDPEASVVKFVNQIIREAI